MSDDPETASEDFQSLLAVNLLDLRAQYEAQLRSLTTAQRALEEYRVAEGPEKRTQTVAVLRQQLQLLRAATTVVTDALTEADREIGLLEASPPR